MLLLLRRQLLLIRLLLLLLWRRLLLLLLLLLLPILCLLHLFPASMVASFFIGCSNTGTTISTSTHLLCWCKDSASTVRRRSRCGLCCGVHGTLGRWRGLCKHGTLGWILKQ